MQMLRCGESGPPTVGTATTFGLAEHARTRIGVHGDGPGACTRVNNANVRSFFDNYIAHLIDSQYFNWMSDMGRLIAGPSRRPGVLLHVSNWE